MILDIEIKYKAFFLICRRCAASLIKCAETRFCIFKVSCIFETSEGHEDVTR